MDLIIALAMVGFTLAVSFGYERGNLLHWIIKPFRHKLLKLEQEAARPGNKIRQLGTRLGYLKDAIHASALHGGIVEERMKTQGIDLAYVAAIDRWPTETEKKDYRSRERKKMEPGTRVVDYISEPFADRPPAGLQKMIDQQLDDGLESHLFVASLDLKKVDDQKQILAEQIEVIRQSQQGPAIRKLDRWAWISKPISECAICMLAWYGTLAFTLMQLAGLATWSDWFICICLAYAIILAPGYIRQLM